MENTDLEQLHKDMGILIKLISYQLVGGKTITEGAPILRRLGLSNAQIADVFDSSQGAIAARVAEAKKRTK